MKPQKIWDKYLLDYALDDGKMTNVLFNFFKDYDESFLNEPYDWASMRNQLIKLKLRRCLDVRRNGELVCNFGRNSVRGFIHSHCKKLAEMIVKHEIKHCESHTLKNYKNLLCFFLFIFP